MHFKSWTKFTFIILFITVGLASANSESIEVTGRIFDKEQNRPVEFANVALLSARDSTIVVGAVSDLQGRFSIKANPGHYILNVGFIGYLSHFQTLELAGGAAKSMGRILLEPDVQSLNEVVIESTAALFESDVDKRTYNVENSILAQGGTARDVLETLPSIQLDEEGNISMRGSGSLLIYINGRPTNLSSDDMESILDQFPANAVSSIELITNPSARYDAAGVGGIINIILKKNQKVGFNGQINAAIGTRHKYNGGLNLNYGGRKINLFANYNYQYRQLWEQTTSFRNVKTGNVSPIMAQDYYNTNYNQSHLLRMGADINISERSAFGFYSQINYSPATRNRRYNQVFMQQNSIIDSASIRLLEEDRRRFNIESGLTYNLELDDKGQSLYLTASYAYNYQERFEYFDQFYFNAFGEEEIEKRENQIYGRPQEDNLFIFQIDYEKPLGKTGKFEAGLKSMISRFEHSQIFEEFNFENNDYIANDTIADRFLFDENVHAAFGLYRNTWGRLGMQAGVRAELTLTESFNRNRDETFTNNYFNVFPSVYLSYDIGNKQELQINYSRRISRPGVGVLAPFYNVQDFLNLRIGNPYLQPVTTDSYELGYNLQREKIFLSSTIYHRYSSDIITRVFGVLGAQNAIVTWLNANNSRDTGLEIINQYTPARWIDATVSANLFYSEIFGDNLGENLSNANFSWTLSMLTNMNFPKVAVFQLQGSYRGPMVLPQGQIEPIWGVNVGVRKDVWNKRATIALNVSDVFNSRIFKIKTDDAVLYQRRTFDAETRIGTLSLTYRFGGFKEKATKASPKDDMGSDPF